MGRVGVIREEVVHGRMMRFGRLRRGDEGEERGEWRRESGKKGN